MQFSEWEPVYSRILDDFGYDASGDRQARDIAREFATAPADGLFAGLSDSVVAIAGAGPNLATETAIAGDAEYVIAASTAADTLADHGVSVDCMVTDLDKNPDTSLDLTDAGVPVVAHAHGDNIPAVKQWLPRFRQTSTVVTTQAHPSGPVHNYGGFTDGDRAAFLADTFGAAELVFLGWSFDDPTVTDSKRQKLGWAERLLFWLEQRRDGSFSPLDGRRDQIVSAATPGNQ